MKNKKKASKLLVAPLLAAAMLAAATVPMLSHALNADAAEIKEHTGFTPAYSSKEESKLAGLELNEEICEEGMVLLKNNGALPFEGGIGTNATKVSLFGYASVHPQGGGAADTGDTSAGVVRLTSNIYSSLQDAGIRTNSVVKDFYDGLDSSLTSDKGIKTTFDQRSDDADFVASLSKYGDAGIVVLSTPEIETVNWIKYNKDKTRHKQQYDEAQYDLIDYVAEHFENVIVLINNVAPVEIAEIQDNPLVDSILLVSEPGDNGFNALGKILTGEVNPSGKLPDIYPADFTKDPVYKNSHNGLSIRGQLRYVTPEYDFSKNELNGQYDAANYDLDPSHQRNTYLMDYEEGIYNGYRYYETVAAEGAYDDLAMATGRNDKINAYGETGLTAEQFATYADPAHTNDDYYNRYNGVVYPFGYGLSYTSFTQKIANKEDVQNTTITSANDVITLKVNVTNTGSVAGKDVVQLYYTAPYNPGGIEKSSVVLGDFEKTDMLAGGDSQTVTIKIKARDMASYDWRKSKVDNGGYILEAGDYVLKIQSDSHNVLDSVTVNVPQDIKITESENTGYTVQNQFDDVNNEIIRREGLVGKSDDGYEYGGFVNLSRNNGFANLYDIQSLTPKDREISDEEYKKWLGTFANGTFEDTEADSWYVPENEMPEYAASAEDRPEVAEIVLSDMIGKSFDDPMWDELVSQLTVEEMEEIVMGGGFMSIANDYIGKPFVRDTDGPKGWTGTGTGGSNLNKFASEPLIAATFNKELSYEMGVLIGEQGFWGNSDNTTGDEVFSYTGWYAPGMNIHRGQFDFRYDNYYSEDPVLTGMMTANLSIGLKSRGGYIFIKHFAMHEDGGVSTTFVDPIKEAVEASGQEFVNFDGYRGGSHRESSMSLWCNEQAMREIYFRGYQIAVEDGIAEAVMTSLSRIGAEWEGADYQLLTNVLRNEWGFKGIVVTDTANNGYRYMDPELMIRAGGNLVLGTTTADRYEDCRFRLEDNASKVTALQKGVKEILYVIANSNAMQAPAGAKVLYSGAEMQNATINQAYTANLATATLNTVNKYSDIHYELVEGVLPKGMTLSADGVLSGTPTQDGVYSFKVAAVAEDYETAVVEYRFVVEDGENVSDIISGAVDGSTSDLSGLIENNASGIADNADKISSLNGTVTAALAVGIVSVVVAGVAVVLLILKKKN